MTPRFIKNAEAYEVDLSFALLPNGDILTSDGLPRGSWDEEGHVRQFGKPPTFRKPTAEEAALLDDNSTALDQAMAQFSERAPE